MAEHQLIPKHLIKDSLTHLFNERFGVAPNKAVYPLTTAQESDFDKQLRDIGFVISGNKASSMNDEQLTRAALSSSEMREAFGTASSLALIQEFQRQTSWLDFLYTNQTKTFNMIEFPLLTNDFNTLEPIGENGEFRSRELDVDLADAVITTKGYVVKIPRKLLVNFRVSLMPVFSKVATAANLALKNRVAEVLEENKTAFNTDIFTAKNTETITTSLETKNLISKLNKLISTNTGLPLKTIIVAPVNELATLEYINHAQLPINVISMNGMSDNEYIGFVDSVMLPSLTLLKLEGSTILNFNSAGTKFEDEKSYFKAYADFEFVVLDNKGIAKVTIA